MQENPTYSSYILEKVSPGYKKGIFILKRIIGKFSQIIIHLLLLLRTTRAD